MPCLDMELMARFLGVQLEALGHKTVRNLTDKLSLRKLIYITPSLLTLQFCSSQSDGPWLLYVTYLLRTWLPVMQGDITPCCPSSCHSNVTSLKHHCPEQEHIAPLRGAFYFWELGFLSSSSLELTFSFFHSRAF